MSYSHFIFDQPTSLKLGRIYQGDHTSQDYQISMMVSVVEGVVMMVCEMYCVMDLCNLSLFDTATATANATAATTIQFLFRLCLKEQFFQSLPFHSFSIIYCIFLLHFIYSERFISPGLVVRTLGLVFL
ncbi:MAG: hypothetical protein EZS28_044661 [Streblomastix strix]|uniref:Uncharacterized protein n=1 Tax=Streblomastix strix TaxID=222440 RepID=A0A5J4TQV0_9EUKA|nr:MAG: hypothetical protein EZS28_044661 [Streblomastix strix]